MKLDWLEDGDIYLLLPERLLGEWRGFESDDFDRANAASDNWLNPLPVGDGIGLVLGGDPAAALFAPGEGDEVVLVRCLAANDEHKLVAFALRGKGVVRAEPDLRFDNPDGRWRLFNAARPGSDFGTPSRQVSSRPARARGAPSRQVSLPVGRVRVQTACLESRSNWAIVHRFSQEAEPVATPAREGGERKKGTDAPRRRGR